MSRFDTMPSKPNLQACSKTVAPFSSVCSLKTIPADERTSSRAVPAHDQPIAVVLDLVHPVGPGKRLGGKGGDAGLDKAIGADAGGHAARIVPNADPTERSDCRAGVSPFILRDGKAGASSNGNDPRAPAWLKRRRNSGELS